MERLWLVHLMLPLMLLWLCSSEASAVSLEARSILLTIHRGGSTSHETTITKSKKTKRKKKKKKTGQGSEKEVIEEAMKEKDAAEALGDAIRQRADEIREEVDPLLQSIDRSISSVGWAMGASDGSSLKQQEEDGGGVEVASNSVIAHYFLKSHGGAHAVQCVCSLLSLLASIASLVWKESSPLKDTLLNRAFLFAMMKHLAGLIAGTIVAAKTIPKHGFPQARSRMEKLALDPVSQYVFYSATIMLWLASTTPWYKAIPLVGKWVHFLLVLPILLREFVSTVFVMSDILVLLAHSGSGEDGNSPSPILTVGQAVVNAFMSLLLTPKVWREASSSQRQAMLARIISKASLAAELLVGVLLVTDGAKAFMNFALSKQRPKLLNMVIRVLCARLFANFLWVRRRKITKLANNIRGGASQIPHRVLDALLDPRASMGIQKTQWTVEGTWQDYVVLGLGLDEL